MRRTWLALLTLLSSCEYARVLPDMSTLSANERGVLAASLSSVVEIHALCLDTDRRWDERDPIAYRMHGTGFVGGVGQIYTAGHLVHACFGRAVLFAEVFRYAGGARTHAYDVPVRVAVYDQPSDVAILDVDPRGHFSLPPPLPICERCDLEVGVEYLSAGFATGWTKGEAVASNVLHQPTAFGDSGGPVFDRAGVVVGIIVRSNLVGTVARVVPVP